MYRLKRLVRYLLAEAMKTLSKKPFLYQESRQPLENARDGEELKELLNLEVSQQQHVTINSQLPLNYLRVAVSRKDFDVTKPIHCYCFLQVLVTYLDDANNQRSLVSDKPLYDLTHRFLFEPTYHETSIDLLIQDNRQVLFEFETFLEHIYNSTGHHTADCSEQCGLSIKSHAKLQEILNTISRHDPKFQADAVKDAKKALDAVKQSAEQVHLQNRAKSASKK